MKNKPAKAKQPVFTQLCKLIPAHLVPKLARTFTPWSHVVSLLFAQLTHSVGLNDACVEMGFKFLPNANCRGYAGIPARHLTSSN